MDWIQTTPGLPQSVKNRFHLVDSDHELTDEIQRLIEFQALDPKELIGKIPTSIRILTDEQLDFLSTKKK